MKEMGVVVLEDRQVWVSEKPFDEPGLREVKIGRADFGAL